MQLKDILELGVREGVRRHVEKRAGVMLPLAVGAMIPGIVHKAVERARSTEQKLASEPDYSMLMGSTMKTPIPFGPGQSKGPMSLVRSTPFSHAMAKGRGYGMEAGKEVGKSMGGGFLSSLGDIGGAPGKGIAHGLSNLVQKKLFGQELGERQDALGIGGRKAIEAAGSEIGKSSVGLLRDIANKAMEAMGHAGDSSAREAILGDLKRTDSVLANADDKTLMEAYHSMTRFAPTLSTDKNAVRSFLRQAVMSGAGPDYMSIKLLADAERAVTGGGDKRAAFNPEGLLMGLREAAPVVGRAALKGAVPGAIAGAVADDDDRLGGAAKGALAGGALGALVGGGSHAKQISEMPDVLYGTQHDIVERIPFTSQHRPRYPGGLSDYIAEQRAKGM